MFYVAYIWRIPFDWQNPVGYFVAIILILLSATTSLIAAACMACLAISVFLIILAFIEDARMALYPMKLSLKIEPKGQQQEHQQMEQLLNFIKLYLVARELSRRVPLTNSTNFLIESYALTFQRCSWCIKCLPTIYAGIVYMERRHNMQYNADASNWTSSVSIDYFSATQNFIVYRFLSFSFHLYSHNLQRMRSPFY